MSEEQQAFDVAVIGGGPGGYVAAIRAAQLKQKVALIEKEPVLGGTCVRVGCIPSKALLESSEMFYQSKHHFADHGISAGELDIDISQMMSRKTSIVKELTDGLNMLMNKNKITVFNGFGSFVSANEIAVALNDGTQTTIQAKSTIIATGSVPIELPHAKFDGKHIISSTEALALESVPGEMLVIGAGAVGLELGSVWCRLGAKVTVVELLPEITPFADKQMSRELRRALEKQGLNILLKHKMTKASVENEKATIVVEDENGTEHTLSADCMLVAVGRKAFSDRLGVEQAGVAVGERGKIAVDSHFRTNISNIYAIGDVIDGPMLAHKAEDEGVAVADIIAGHVGHVNYDLIPNIVYTEPELAMVGWTEEQAKEKGHTVKTGKYRFIANGRAKTLGSVDGLVKIIADKETDRVLGVHIVGPRASDMIAEAVIAMEFSASAEDIARTCHAHPTLSEVMKEAAMAVDRRAIHG